VFGLGQGYEFATKDLAVERVGREIRLHPTGRFDGARVVVNGVTRRIDLAPERTETILVESDVREISIAVHHDKKVLLSYQSPLAIPLETAPKLEEKLLSATTAEDGYLLGQDFDRRMEPVKARKWYERALAIDAMHYDALVALAVLDLEAGLLDDAAARLDRARARDPEKGWAHYLAGIAAFRSGKIDVALARGYLASKRHGLRSLGLGLAGRALMRLDRPDEALAVFRAAYAPGGQDDRRLFDALLIAALSAGEKEEAVRLARGALEEGSVRLVPRAVLALAGEKSMEAFAREARDYLGEDDFTILEAALAFDELGRRDAARRILEVSVSSNPLTYYYLAYWGGRGDPLETAARLEHDRVFPSRGETIPVLQFVIERTDDERAHLMLGNLYAGLGRVEEAVRAWTKAKSSSVAHRSLAMTAWKRDGELNRAALHFTEAIEQRPSDQTLYRDLGRLRLEQGRAADAIELLSTMPVGERRRADVTLLLARAYVAGERYGDAIDLLAATTFSNREGDSGTWSVFSKAHIERGIERMNRGAGQEALDDFETALLYPKNLNVGRPARPQEARALFWTGKALGALEKPEEAVAAWSECASNQPLSEEQRDYMAECQSALSSR
jgi:tetratricopeptide (TPR) repeat protein